MRGLREMDHACEGAVLSGWVAIIGVGAISLILAQIVMIGASTQPTPLHGASVS